MTREAKSVTDGHDDPVVVALLTQRDQPITLPWLDAPHPRRTNFTYPEPDHGLRLAITPRWWLEIPELVLKDGEDELTAIAYIALAQYFRWQGADAAALVGQGWDECVRVGERPLYVLRGLPEAQGLRLLNPPPLSDPLPYDADYDEYQLHPDYADRTYAITEVTEEEVTFHGWLNAAQIRFRIWTRPEPRRVYLRRAFANALNTYPITRRVS